MLGLSSKNGHDATMPDLNTPLDAYPVVIAAREALFEIIAQRELLDAEWTTVCEVLKTDIPTSSSRLMPSSEEKKLASKRKAALVEEAERLDEEIARARTRHADAKKSAKRKLVEAYEPHLRKRAREAYEPLEQAAVRVDAVAQLYRQMTDLGQLNLEDQAQYQLLLSHFIVTYGSAQWAENKKSLAGWL